MNNKLIIILLIGIVLVSGCTTHLESESEHGELEYKYSKLDWCEKNIKTLTCDELLECYDECFNLPIISWQMNCRDQFKARIWKCYGVNPID